MCSYQLERNSSLLTRLLVLEVLLQYVIWQLSYPPKNQLHCIIPATDLKSGERNEFQFCKCVFKRIL